MWEVVGFSVNQGGYWVKNHLGELGYVCGEVISFECKPEELFARLSTELGDRFYGQNIWYKLPFEDNKERKRLTNEDSSFQRMCEAAKWTGFVDVYLVNATEHPDDDSLDILMLSYLSWQFSEKCSMFVKDN